ncbi:MAG: DNA alkylation repair protein [Bacteroidia bacterium]|jgi:3-methyladenine DNA glycosylase AlkD
MLHPWVKNVQQQFHLSSNPIAAQAMSAYMKNHFPYLGISSPHRTELLKPLLEKERLPAHQDLPQICEQLWLMPEREFAYAALSLLAKMQKQLTPSDIPWICNFITKRSWWDSVDSLAGGILSTIVCKNPECLWPHFEPLIASDNFWLNRTAMIVQLRCKEKTDTDFLESAILPHMHSKEFFVRKAIGWSLRQYAKTNPQWVIDFVNKHKEELSGLSIREALKHL